MMPFNLLIGSVTFVFNSVSQVFLLASNTGGLILSIISLVVSTIFGFFKNIYQVFHIFYKDNKDVFSKEIPEMVYGGVDTLVQQVENLLISFINTAYNITHLCFTLLLGLLNYLDFLHDVVLRAVTFSFGTLLVFGEIIWHLITFVPLNIPIFFKNIILFITNNIFDCIVTSYENLLGTTNFLSEVPLEAFIGIISMILTVRLFMHYKSNIQRNIIKFCYNVKLKTLCCYYMFYNYVMNPDSRLIMQIIRNEQIEPRDLDLNHFDDREGDHDDGLCVACKVRAKTMLILPCKHICLCWECCTRLYDYQRKCPICRTFICHSVTVYY